MVAVLEVYGLEHAEICRALHQSLSIPWGEFQVGDPGITGMVRVDSEVHGAIELFVGARRRQRRFPEQRGCGS